MNERFSAFLDNEATRDESDAVVNELLRDEKLRVSWSRQHQIRDALRASHGEANVSVDVDFAARVMRAVENETAPAGQNSPRAGHATITVETGRGNVVPMSRKGRHRWRNVAGLAVAASAAGFALFVTQPLQRLDIGGAMTTIADTTVSQPSSVASAGSNGTAGLSFETVAAADTADTSGFGDFDIPWDLGNSLAQRLASGVDHAQTAVDHWSVSNPTLANRLNKLLFEHNGLARGYGLGATTPAFVRVATYGQDIPQ